MKTDLVNHIQVNFDFKSQLKSAGSKIAEGLKKGIKDELDDRFLVDTKAKQKHTVHNVFASVVNVKSDYYYLIDSDTFMINSKYRSGFSTMDAAKKAERIEKNKSIGNAYIKFADKITSHKEATDLVESAGNVARYRVRSGMGLAHKYPNMYKVQR